ncbi:hypothetical protein RND81_08G141400 [Saponaria officinalis]
MESPNPSEVGNSPKDSLNQRLKNRERQRRYREKKRRRTDSSHVSETNQSSQMQIIILPTDVPAVEAVTRVYCKRDWKKEARRAHARNQKAVSNGIASNGQSLPGTQQVPNFPSVTPVVPSAFVGNSENVRIKLGRRDWKAEARSKRN